MDAWALLHVIFTLGPGQQSSRYLRHCWLLRQWGKSSEALMTFKFLFTSLKFIDQIKSHGQVWLQEGRKIHNHPVERNTLPNDLSEWFCQFRFPQHYKSDHFHIALQALRIIMFLYLPIWQEKIIFHCLYVVGLM